MIIKLAWADKALKLIGREFAPGAKAAFNSALKSPIVKSSLIGAGVGAASGLITGNEDHKVRSMLTGAVIGGAGSGIMTGAMNPDSFASLKSVVKDIRFNKIPGA